MNHRFTLYEQRTLHTRRINRRISICMGIAAVAIAIGLMWLTSIPGAP
jgi:hypothetical protein